ncbi:MAG: nucleotide sugar dehydrogenase [Deltaproteobacteria bacterium]|nr:nucleotide sugar dehydrogenase [Deltaproteobacteria bacterium]
MDLSHKIQNRSATVGVIGLGYVGLPLALEFIKAGYCVIGVDTSRAKIKKLESKKSYITDISDEDLEQAFATGRLRVSQEHELLKEADSISICVPTPLRKTKEPDISFIVSATRKLSRVLRSQQLIVLESTTYPGTTEEVVLPELEKGGFKVGQDFYLAFSPERIDPGNPHFHLKNTPKIIGGHTEACTKMAVSLYSSIVDRVITVSSPKAAEMVKLLENTFRAVNIGLVNEMAIMADRLNLDVWEIIDAASTKPFGFMPFYPGPGLGGHCIPVDPHYLSWKLKTLNYTPRFIDLAEEINLRMPVLVVDKIAFALNRFKKAINGSKILILGVSYKKDVGDVRESPALDILELLQQRGAAIFYEDTYCPHLELHGKSHDSIALAYDRFCEFDCVAMITNHSYYDISKIVECAPIVVDCRNATKAIKNKTKIIKI